MNRYKIYSYPYLADYSSDYRKSTFRLESTPGKNADNIVIRVSYKIMNQEINQEIAEGKLKVVCQIYCRTLGLVKTKEFNNKSNEIITSFDPLDLEEEVEIKAYLIANISFPFKNKDLSIKWIDENAFVQKNNIIGESNSSIITIKHAKSGDKRSIFSFVPNKDMETKDGVRILLSEERIIFSMSPDMFKYFNRVQSKKEELVICGFLVPAITEILSNMKEKDDEPNNFNLDYQSKNWYKVIFYKYERFFDKDPREGLISPFLAAQKLFTPFALHNLMNMVAIMPGKE